ncbi:Nup133 N terminal like-domain-containing protein [Truncatella angustata]|uniref:Nup133 N terminal like-domain-containing protein n=1 Tax=Truncatella angustata TaxID=152316 RepID=A0A9P8UI69_9PEZI|nr:Nup133 N terminal like-domain-containing protein [Truncatella angustata]KAH6652823.1 Nup133 N terminal like-domain-containing protein [Truncatella angustata]
MFSSLNSGAANSTGTPASSTRGRRRQRPVSDESVRQPKAKRARIPLNEQTFNPEANQNETYEVKPARSSVASLKQDGIDGIENSPSQTKKELSFRSKKAKTGERLSKGDGSVVLTSNNAFAVSKLPALPDRLRADAQSRQHGVLDPSTGYALSLTHTHAVVWPYSVSSSSPESFTFSLPYPSRHSSDPLPLGSLVPPSASSSEPGLVVVMPTSGKITYWESISSASTLDFMRQQRNGVEDSISGMWSSENVIQIVSAEAAAGFVLAFSSGRMAYMSVRDAHGKPAIALQFLRTTLGPSTGGIFGSLRHLVSSSSIQGEIAAVRSDRSLKQGEQTVVAATVKGRFHAWKIHRGGHHDLLTEFDAKETIVRAIAEVNTDNSLSHDSLKIHDFAFVPKDMDDKHADMSQLRHAPASVTLQHILVLASLSSKNVGRYFLVEVNIPNGASAETPITVGTVRPITSYTTPPDPHALVKPRLHLPRPAVVSFLVFERAVIIASIAKAPASPDSQLQFENHTLPPTYEDVIDLRADPTLEVVASNVEEPQAPGSDESRTYRIKAKNPSAILLIRGTGTVRVATTDIERFASEQPPKITPKGKLEQAVFFGIKDDNPLVFDVPRQLPFSDKELADAALELSQDILTSNSPHLASLAPHLENNMLTRVRALEKLIVHLNSLKVKLGRATKWELLWNAEKLQTARLVWAKHEKFVHDRADDDKKDLIADIVYYIRDEEKNQPNVAKGEVDTLRHWFVHDSHRMNIFLAWAYEVIKYQSKAKAANVILTRLIYEAVEVMNGALRDAMEFRRRHLALYGLSGEKLANGILASNYADLPNPWTSDQFIANNLKRLVELASEWVNTDNHATSPTDAEKPLIQRIRTLLPDLTEVYLTSLQELSRWALVSDDPNTVKLGETFEETYQSDRYDKIILLAASQNWTAAYRLAEEHKALDALGLVLITEEQEYKAKLERGGLSPEESRRLQDLLDAKAEQRQTYMEKYGKEFAFPYYEHLIDQCGVDAVLEENGDKLFKTPFLRTHRQYAKLSWIHDITTEGDIISAGDTLVDLGLHRENKVWNKKIELSLGKLARMAEASRPSSKASFSAQAATISANVTEAGVEAIDKELAIIRIQDDLFEQLRPVLETALDESAQLALVVEAFAPKIPKKYKILLDIFENGLDRLLKRDALDPLTLIDILTLAQLDADFKQAMPDQFFEALEVAHYGIKDAAQREEAERLIWRRCFLREEWTKINNTSLKGDTDVMEVLGNTELFQVFCVLYTIQHEAEPRNYRRWLPSEVLGVYTEQPDKRFIKGDKSTREKLLEAMQWEDNNLNKHIEKHRLDHWAKETRKLAEAAVDDHADTKTAEGAISPAFSPSRSRSKASNGFTQNGSAH